MPKTFPARGFTLIELLVAISLTVIIGSFGLAYYSSFNRRQIVEQTAKKIVSDIRLAQNLALAQQKPLVGNCACITFKGYSFFVAESSYWIVPDCEPACIANGNKVKSVELENVLLSGELLSIKFAALTQGVKRDPDAGTLIVGSKDGLYHREIIIGDSGDLTIEE